MPRRSLARLNDRFQSSVKSPASKYVHQRQGDETKTTEAIQEPRWTLPVRLLPDNMAESRSRILRRLDTHTNTSGPLFQNTFTIKPKPLKSLYGLKPDTLFWFYFEGKNILFGSGYVRLYANLTYLSSSPSGTRRPSPLKRKCSG